MATRLGVEQLSGDAQRQREALKVVHELEALRPVTLDDIRGQLFQQLQGILRSEIRQQIDIFGEGIGDAGHAGREDKRAFIAAYPEDADVFGFPDVVDDQEGSLAASS
jgi:hypothetical protein